MFTFSERTINMSAKLPLSATMARKMSELHERPMTSTELSEARQNDANEVTDLLGKIDDGLMQIFSNIEKVALKEKVHKDFRYVTRQFTPFEGPLKLLGYDVVEGPIGDPYDAYMGYYISW